MLKGGEKGAARRSSSPSFVDFRRAVEEGNPRTVGRLLLKQSSLALSGWARAEGDAHVLSALKWACCHGHAVVASLLLEHGADPSSPDECSALEETVIKGHTSVVEVLLKQPRVRAPGVLNSRFEEGCTPLWRAACAGHAGIVRQLLRAGADVNLASEYGRTPLDVARLAGREECARLLQVSTRTDS
jgi:ankyrin repeat protein